MINIDKLNQTVDFLKNLTDNFEPEIAIILGSGLGNFADNLKGKIVKYFDIPNFESSKVVGHKGQLIFTEMYGKKVVLMQGRFHYYEGHSIDKISFPIAVFKKLGVKKLILTNAAGGVNTSFSVGDLMLITDHINLMGTNPLIGDNSINMGERFPDMSEVYPKDLRNITIDCANKLSITLKEGVYAAVTGPSYETPAEIKMFQIIGADAIGMSTAPEAIFANYCGIKVLGISCITNLAAGLNKNKLTHAEVIETTEKINKNFKALLNEIIAKI